MRSRPNARRSALSSAAFARRPLHPASAGDPQSARPDPPPQRTDYRRDRLATSAARAGRSAPGDAHPRSAPGYRRGVVDCTGDGRRRAATDCPSWRNWLCGSILSRRSSGDASSKLQQLADSWGRLAAVERGRATRSGVGRTGRSGEGNAGGSTGGATRNSVTAGSSLPVERLLRWAAIAIAGPCPQSIRRSVDGQG